MINNTINKKNMGDYKMNNNNMNDNIFVHNKTV